MRLINRKTLILALIIFLSFNSQGQKSIGAKSFVKEKNVYIRWVPSNLNVLLECNERGYVLKRIKWSDQSLPDTAEFKNAEPKYVSSYRSDASEWKNLSETNEASGFIHDLLYRTVSEKAKDFGSLFGLAMLSCDFDIHLSTATGLFYKEEIISSGTYAYLIQPKDLKLRNAIKPAIVLINTKIENTLSEIDSLIISSRGREVKLQWNIERSKKDYAGYFIERSDDNKNFTQLNKQPHILIKTQYEKEKKIIFYNDTSLEFNKTYYYRVKGLSFFGLHGNYSKTVKIKLIKPLTDLAEIDSIQLYSDSIFRISWHSPKKIKLTEIKGYNIYCSKEDKGSYRKINKLMIKNDVSSFLDEHPYKTSFYKIVTYNIYGDSLISNSHMSIVPDKTPPKVPMGFTGNIDSTGKVVLRWSHNKESDLVGYRIFRNNAINEEPVEITRKILSDNTYTDSVDLNTLTNYVLYYITAVDQVYNNSPYSKPLQIKRPDKIEPVGVVFTSISHNDSAITLKWIPSTSSDVARYELWRKGNNGFEKIRTWSSGDTIISFADDQLSFANYFQYKIRVYDTSGNFSETVSPNHFFDSRIRKAIKVINYEVDRKEKLITINWQYPEKDIYNFVLYKAKKGEEMKVFRTIKANSFSYTDKELYIGNVYVYKIKANFNSGAESLISNDIEVIY